MPFFSRVFRSKDGSPASKNAGKHADAPPPPPQKPTWTDAWARTEVSPDEVDELLRGCTSEIKARGLDLPFLLLPFRPSSDPSSARTFVRNFFSPPAGHGPLCGEALKRELRLTEPMVICSVVKWCWSRLPGGVVTWDVYELFKVGEQDSQFARDAFSTFIPLSVDSDARIRIIFDFFNLLAAIAAHGKLNGLAGRKLSRYAGWWAFEHHDTGDGFEASYRNWASAADATSHLFFAYLRSQSPDDGFGASSIVSLPMALQELLRATEYPPGPPTLLQITTTRVVMVVEHVSPTPFALLRRARNFQYHEADAALRRFAAYPDPVNALTDECRRVLRAIASINQSNVASTKASTNLDDASWARFLDLGFDSSSAIDEDEDDAIAGEKLPNLDRNPLALRSSPAHSSGNIDRPTTPSWADFLSSGFNDDNDVLKSKPAYLLPPDKALPPIESGRARSSSHLAKQLQGEGLDPGELAGVSDMNLEDSFWWVWISSLAGEEPIGRKAVFGRCALIETIIPGSHWMVLEEQVRGAAPEPEEDVYAAEKKGLFGIRSTRRNRLGRSKTTTKNLHPSNSAGPDNSLYPPRSQAASPTPSKSSIAPDQHARIQAAASAVQRKKREQERAAAAAAEREAVERRRNEISSGNTNSVVTLQPSVLSEASEALAWANNYDKTATVRDAYLQNPAAGTGQPLPPDEIHPALRKRHDDDEIDHDNENGKDNHGVDNNDEKQLPLPPSPNASASAPLRPLPVDEPEPGTRKASVVSISSPSNQSDSAKEVKFSEQRPAGSKSSDEKKKMKMKGINVFGGKKKDKLEGSSPPPASPAASSKPASTKTAKSARSVRESARDSVHEPTPEPVPVPVPAATNPIVTPPESPSLMNKKAQQPPLPPLPTSASASPTQPSAAAASPTPPRKTANPDGPAVAAAKATLESRVQENSPSPRPRAHSPSRRKLARRMSTLVRGRDKKKDGKEDNDKADDDDKGLGQEGQVEASDAAGSTELQREVTVSPSFPATEGMAPADITPAPLPTPRPTPEPVQHQPVPLANFEGQTPFVDAPVFVPNPELDPVPEHDQIEPSNSRDVPVPTTIRRKPAPIPAQAVVQNSALAPSPGANDTSSHPGEDTSNAVRDRWAQIRKNAAERAAMEAATAVTAVNGNKPDGPATESNAYINTKGTAETERVDNSMPGGFPASETPSANVKGSEAPNLSDAKVMAAATAAAAVGSVTPANSDPSGEDDETSGEETIERRVARIKARVAELTGNMEAARSS